MMTFVDPGGHAGDELLAAVAASLSGRLAEITQDVTEYLAAAIEQLQGDTAILGVLRASVTENITAIFHVFEHGMPVDNIEAPPAAIEYARRLAQRGVPAGALIRAYRVGHERFLQWCLDELARQGREVPLVVAAARRMVELSSGYIDRVTEQVFTVYEHERDRWLLTQTAMRAGRVRALLEDKQVDLGTVEAELGYRLRQDHVGLIAWHPSRPRGARGWPGSSGWSWRPPRRWPVPAGRCWCHGMRPVSGPGCRWAGRLTSGGNCFTKPWTTPIRARVWRRGLLLPASRAFAGRIIRRAWRKNWP